MSLFSIVPRDHKEWHEQTKLSDITDEEFNRQIKPVKYARKHIIFQIICFILTLGPIRAVFGFVGFFSCCAIAGGLRRLQYALGMDTTKYKTFLLRIVQLGFRCLFIVFNHIWIRKEGTMDPDARVIICNHTAFHDPMIISCTRDTSVVMKASFGEGVARWVFDIIDPIYVRRDMPGGQTKLIIDHANNKELLPILIFPEGTLTNGDIFLKFHRGAFLTDHKVQPMLVRYHMPFVPEGWNSFAWTEPNILLYFWYAMSVPLNWVTVKILPAHSKSEYANADEFADAMQLQCANAFGVLASTRSSNDIFRKKTEEKVENKEKKE
ncbi:Acyltransferase family protein [Trichomonas vaginalis G3]|uniref:Acyltransferase family protein n=1 Tax=Trichomonas vaginalis (strain ATCC PRA-98 / G3) TaxID=412133 RepID=A2DPE6_TRIV3|nr:1-alkylglycerophosphocholine O-acetyltransferase protein [Trichomonas vaginalis G3]EAY17690.1 Acyltransferase family protein [Trichomonas vaginalis G3]KAI5507906.1 1-alkylglycerophosphocholine O-acetyltransferase protein [Trichomonas vaginalis G3]|eukprot:XP_001329825.1 Acyltransferase family protein [Trichomonas vaginalis G3]